MKILTFKNGEVTNFGGINKTVLELNTELSEMGHDCTVVTTNTLNLPEKESYNGFNIIRLDPGFEDFFYGLNIKAFIYIKKHLNDLNLDIIHIHGYHGLFSIGAIYIIRKLNKTIPIIFSPHLDTYRSTYAGKYFWSVFNYFGKKALKRTSRVISCSNYEASNILKLDINSKIFIIPHGIDIKTDFKKKTKEGKGNRTIKLVYSGFLINRKGVPYILESLHCLIYKVGFKDVILTIIGEGPEKDNLLKLTKRLKLEKYIIWNSFLDRNEFIKKIEESDIFLLLSESEAYGITVAEALFLGTPCIVTNKTALGEFLDEPGCFGVDYPPDPNEVANLIMNIHENDVKVGPFSKKIRTWKEVAENYEDVYINLIGGYK